MLLPDDANNGIWFSKGVGGEEGGNITDDEYPFNWFLINFETRRPWAQSERQMQPAAAA